jgi:hypothetical protein
VINPFALFDGALRRGSIAMREFSELSLSEPHVFKADATKLSAAIEGRVGAVITSPPYHAAVDYYRRHQLEMYWLGLVRNHEERLRLRSQYMGAKPKRSHSFIVQEDIPSPFAADLEKRMRKTNPERADTFKHYCVAMSRVFQQMHIRLNPRGKAVFVVGNSRWGDEVLNSADLLEDLAFPWFRLGDVKEYSVKNRYMSYTRHNAASIDREFVLVFSRA